ncbi:MAG: hypothetical protein U0792_09690 [Gemmataceae bacterium]
MSDTYLGRSLMRPRRRRPGISRGGRLPHRLGKGTQKDNYPLRPEDRDFQETLWSWAAACSAVGLGPRWRKIGTTRIPGPERHGGEDDTRTDKPTTRP